MNEDQAKLREKLNKSHKKYLCDLNIFAVLYFRFLIISISCCCHLSIIFRNPFCLIVGQIYEQSSLKTLHTHMLICKCATVIGYQIRTKIEHNSDIESIASLVYVVWEREREQDNLKLDHVKCFALRIA